MSQTASEKIRWTTADLQLFPENGNRYEIIDGDLLITRAPSWQHQVVCGRIFAALDAWSVSTGLGRAAIAPGVIFSDADNVIPDVVWASNARLEKLLDPAGHLTGAPELIVEVLSPGKENQLRDKEAKLKLYSSRGVQEYWLVDCLLQEIQVYLRETVRLVLVATWLNTDSINFPLLPGFSCAVAPLFA